MKNNNLLDTKTLNSNDILGNGKKYVVPIYQRDYSWIAENWEDLWEDILLVNEKEEAVHYMGAIVLQSGENKEFSIIDGQQRLVTITILALACIKKIKDLANNNIDKQANEERVRILSTKFIGDKDPASLTHFSKLRLNENNDSFFQTYIALFTRPTNPVLRTFKDSNKLLLKAFEFFYEKINKHFENNHKGEEITKFLTEIIAEKLMFIQIIVEDELRAYTVFETLNSRGARLTVTDLLKNYLFSLASKVDIPHVQKQWDRIVDVIGLNDFPVFLRHYWISKNKLIRQEHLYKNIRLQVKNANDLFELLDQLETNAVVYMALNNNSDDLWKENKHYKELRKSIKELELFQVKQCLPFLLISYEKLPAIFAKIAKIVTVISFRQTVIGGYHGSKLEDEYNKTALKIASGEITTATEIANELKTLYVSDPDFKNVFSTIPIKTRSNKKLIRYILFEIENQMNNNGNTYDFEENPATIEHILPENAKEEWELFFSKKEMENYVFRLGNYTLLEEGKNNNIGNKTFDIKKEIYKESAFKSTSSINYPKWNASNLDKRQTDLAKIATAIWKISY